ncbi:MAG: ERF family protein [Candidatus Micrarchaeota archaeon]|nr:ERF family protein [Candidatus Micrarchaeota archaeon]
MNAIVQVENEPSILAIIARAASDPAVDVDKMQKLLDMKERMDAKLGESEFNAAMSAVQAELRRIVADASNPQTRSKYASYAALDRVVRPIYTTHGFALSFDTGETTLDQAVRVQCYVSHRGGFSRTYHVDMPADGKGAKGGDVMTKTHATGSAMSYGMRYLLKMIFNIAIGEDDDGGNAAGNNLPRITQDQALNLKALLDETGSSEAAFLKWAKVERLEDIAAQAYPDMVKAIETKRKSK